MGWLFGKPAVSLEGSHVSICYRPSLSKTYVPGLCLEVGTWAKIYESLYKPFSFYLKEVGIKTNSRETNVQNSTQLS